MVFLAPVFCDMDVNGDGYDDILIGMDNYDSCSSDEGAVFLWYGRATGRTNYNWMARGNATYAHFGFALDSAGDVNGDGFDDIIVAGWLITPRRRSPMSGSAAPVDWAQRHARQRGLDCHHGDRAGTWRAASATSTAMAMTMLCWVTHYDGGFTDQGAVYVWYGSATGLGYERYGGQCRLVSVGGQAWASSAGPVTGSAT